ncbi:DUF5344 family protein [Bacillus sp. FSL W7-1360]
MEIKINVEEAALMLKAVGDVAGSFEVTTVENTDELDMMTKLDSQREAFNETLEAYMSASHAMALEFENLVLQYERVDQELATKIGSS